MEWTLRLVGTEIDGQSRSYELMAITRPDSLGDIADLGMTVAEAKQLLVQVQQQVVADQATTHAAFRPGCRSYVPRERLATAPGCRVVWRGETEASTVPVRWRRLWCGDRCQSAIALSVDA
jgi:hypothetical protein